MTWLRLDDRFAEHPKIAGLTNQAFRDHVAAMCYCARNRTKGRVSTGVIRLLRISPKTVAELTKAIVWDPGDDDDYFIHDWATFNPPAREMTEEDKAAEAERKAAAGRLGGLASGAARRSIKESDEAETKQVLLQNEAETKQTGEAETNPRNPSPVTRNPSASTEASEDLLKPPRAGRETPIPPPPRTELTESFKAEMRELFTGRFRSFDKQWDFHWNNQHMHSRTVRDKQSAMKEKLEESAQREAANGRNDRGNAANAPHGTGATGPFAAFHH